ncbi:MAG: ABC transporter permease [Euryarchaeota archaeon]|nr:ABC transporter permease [Euryarchaeota archaeon]|tara:strand:- start:827 stop:1561 length:735 start_codon:yes stop_codon:yes gene_type:complete
MRVIFHIGRYTRFIGSVLRRPDKWSMFRKLLVQEMGIIGIDSIGIVTLLASFMGAVMCLQTAHQVGGWIPVYTIGFTVRQTTILEFSPTLIPIILAGKVGSNIASQLGTMRVTEQIDALEIMGVNSAGHLVLPKILAGFICIPILVVMSMFLGIASGALIAILTGVSSMADYQYGVQVDFKTYDVIYALIKTSVFALIMTSVSAYHGYFTEGGALDVARSSTKAVVYSAVIIMISNLVLTQILL